MHPLLRVAARTTGLVVLSASLSSQIFVAGYTFDDLASPDLAVLQPGSDPQFAGLSSGCVSVPQLPSLSVPQSASAVLVHSDLESWIFGKTLVRLDFLDNLVVNAPGPDLVVFELGGAESFALSIFVESICEWTAPRTYSVSATGFSQDVCGIGTNAINAAAIDLTDFGVLPGATVRRVLLDNKGVSGGSVGADVALVMALNSAAPTTELSDCLLDFQQGIDAGVGVYTGAVDTCLASDSPTTAFGAAVLEYSDSTPERNLLMRFDGLVGSNPGQVPPGALIQRAMLTVSTGAGNAASNGTHAVHRVLQPWNAATATWANAFGGDGVDADGVEAEVAPLATLPAMTANASKSVDVTAAVQAWADGAPNRGFVFLANTADGLGLHLSEALVESLRPALTVEVAGNVAYASAVTSFSPNIVNGEPSICFLTPEEVLGPPDWVPVATACCIDVPSTVTLGSGGSIVLEVTSASIAGDGSPEPDLWIYERGDDVEDTFVDVSADLVTWYPLGKVLGAVSAIDLDGFGFGPLDLFRYVRLTDDPAEGQVVGCSVGADVDAISVLSPNPWVNLGASLAGTTGAPAFSASGPLVGNGLIEFRLTNAPTNASAYFVLGVTALSAPFKGGTLVPNPDLLVGGLPTGPLGSLEFGLPWPSGVPAGLPIWIQYWISDAGGPFGFAASNAITSITK